MNKTRGQWSSNIGFIFATAGSAIGLGNIWKFPGKVGMGGGGAFMVIYFAIVFTVGISIMLTELVVGRKTQKNAVEAFNDLNPKWKFTGILGVLSAFIVLSYYCVIGGYVLKYVVTYIAGANFSGGYEQYFNSFVTNPITPIIYLILFMALTSFIVTCGISGGIEKANKLLMPTLFILLFILLIRSLTIKGASEGISFLFTFDFGKITPNILLTALGQALFSLSIGLGTACTYASYLGKKENLAKNAGVICTLDTFVAFLSAFIIIPAVFATGTPLTSGNSFAFIALPGIFDKMPAGTFFGGLFYILLTFAALTSSISLMETIVAYVSENMKMSRKKAAVIISSSMLFLGILYSLSQGALPLHGIWYTVRDGITFPTFGVMMEHITDYIMIPLGGLFFCVFVGWIWGSKNAIDEITQNGTIKFRLQKIWSFTIKYIAPILIAIVMIMEFAGNIKF
ncbi:MAG: sodium-dependent transporter [Clostridia bacterium]|nr:sodium-dependent transporter [Clostridia bacterium]